jgi:hypothetical protein
MVQPPHGGFPALLVRSGVDGGSNSLSGADACPSEGISVVLLQKFQLKRREREATRFCFWNVLVLTKMPKRTIRYHLSFRFWYTYVWSTVFFIFSHHQTWNTILDVYIRCKKVKNKVINK